jgi:hypothetical protein
VTDSSGIVVTGDIDGLTVGGTSSPLAVTITGYTLPAALQPPTLSPAWFTFPTPLSITTFSSPHDVFTVDATGTIITAGDFNGRSDSFDAFGSFVALALTKGSGTNVGGVNQELCPSSGPCVQNATDGGQWDAVPVSSTPLPTALPLFATGIGGLGLLGWRRKRKARAGA